MTAIIPLSGGSKLPAYLQNRKALATINAEVITGGAGFPVLSIKGKVFTLVKDGERKVLTRPDDPDEVLQFINLTVVRANSKSRVFYAKAYVEGSEGDLGRPDCYSQDGVAPAADARDPQAKKCQACKHAVWGSKTSSDGQGSKGTACTVNTRLAVVDPDQILQSDEVDPYLLRVPAGSRSNFNDVVKAAEARGIPYNALALKVGFDKEAPSPKLTFKLVGLVDDPVYEKVQSLYETDEIKNIVGLGPMRDHHEPEAPAGNSATEDDLDAALAAKAAKQAAEATAKAKATKPAPKPEASMDDLDALMAGDSKQETAAPAPKPRTTAKPTPEPEAAPAPAAAGPNDDLLGDLDSLLASTDD